jgi:hypothetical protein
MLTWPVILICVHRESGQLAAEVDVARGDSIEWEIGHFHHKKWSRWLHAERFSA